MAVLLSRYHNPIVDDLLHHKYSSNTFSACKRSRVLYHKASLSFIMKGIHIPSLLIGVRREHDNRRLQGIALGRVWVQQQRQQHGGKSRYRFKFTTYLRASPRGLILVGGAAVYIVYMQCLLVKITLHQRSESSHFKDVSIPRPLQ